MSHLSLTVTGMSCTGCEQRISTVLGRLDGVHCVDADHRAGTVVVDFDADALDETVITGRLADAGYETASPEERR